MHTLPVLCYPLKIGTGHTIHTVHEDIAVPIEQDHQNSLDSIHNLSFKAIVMHVAVSLVRPQRIEDPVVAVAVSCLRPWSTGLVEVVKWSEVQDMMIWTLEHVAGDARQRCAEIGTGPCQKAATR